MYLLLLISVALFDLFLDLGLQSDLLAFEFDESFIMVVLDFNKFFLDRSDHLNDLAIRGFIVHFWLGSGSPRLLPIVCDDIQCLLVHPARETFFIGPGN